MSSDEQSDKECPLCMEPFDEVNFYPCSCQYQICPFCWHRIRTDENGLCPACRQPYPEKPVNFQPSAELRSGKNERKQRNRDKTGQGGVAKSQKTHADGANGQRKVDRQHLSVFRVLQRNLVYVIGLSQRLADAELLKKQEYFGKFGRILKIAVGTLQTPNHSNNGSHNGGGASAASAFTAYVTYGKMEEALKAIQTVNNLVIDGRLLKASLGTTKYCSNFLKAQHCHKQECMYLHEIADDELSFTKEDMHQGKHTEYERKLHEQMQAAVAAAAASNQAAATSTQSQKLQRQNTNNTEQQNNNNLQSQQQAQDVTAAISAVVEPTAATAIRPPVGDSGGGTPPDIGMTAPTTVNSTTTTNTAASSLAASSSGAISGAMTCSELEQLLIHRSVPPPGFHDFAGGLGSLVMNTSADFFDSNFQDAQPPDFYGTPPPGFHSPPAPIEASLATVMGAEPSSREPSVVPSASDFFLDLYDDLGFDPFTESSKALADMLEQEKTNSPR